MNKLYDNCFTTQWNTKVVQVVEEDGRYWHACKDTIFYMESGGMASDIGMINDQMVLDLKYEDGYVWHLLNEAVEGPVVMSVNLHERFRKCQIHTAQHLISALMKNIYKVETLAHHVHDDENDIEFDFDEFNEKMAFELQVLCNGLIRDDLEVKIIYPRPSEAQKYVSKKDVNREDLRVVQIGTLDYNPCGCMHVPSLRYLQMIYISGFEKTKNGYKIKYLVGDQLLDCTSKRYDVLNELSSILALPHLYLSTGVHRILNENKQLSRDVIVWKEKYYECFASQLANTEESLVVKCFENIDARSLCNMAQYISEHYKKHVLFAAKIYDKVHVVVASSNPKEYNAIELFKQLEDKYCLKGGGNNVLAQGGGVYQDIIFEEISNFVL